MSKLNFLGIGPRIGAIAIPWLVITIFLTLKLKNLFSFSDPANRTLYIIGLIILIAGILMYFITVPSLMKGLKETKMVTSGTYYFCCNPLYTAILLMIIPGVSLMMNSWLVLTTSVLGYIIFKIFIKKEYSEMEKLFGESYRKYREETPEFFPFPLKKLFRA